MKKHRLVRAFLYLTMLALAGLGGAKVHQYLTTPPTPDLSDVKFRFWDKEVSEMPVVEVFYVTNRQPVAGHVDEFSRKASESLSYGKAEVRMPASLRIGDGQTPEIARKMISDRHAVILEVKPLTEAEFFAELSARLSETQSQLFNLLIHGIDHSFDSAVRQAATLSFDLDMPQPMVVFAWPTTLGLLPGSYARDRAQVDASARQLANFLEALQKNVHPRELNVVAHSLGCKVACETFAFLVPETSWNEDETKISNIVLAAPDVGREDFDKTFVEDMAKISKRVTVYVSSNDGALAASAYLNGRERAGVLKDRDVPLENILKQNAADAPHIQIVDATYVNNFFTAHSSFYQSRSAFFDLHNLLGNDLPAERRHLLKHEKAGRANYWILRP